MTKFETIPKIVNPKEIDSYFQRIPKIIWQTLKTNKVPAYMKSFSDTWIKLNPEYKYRFFDDNDIITFLIKEFPEFVEGYNSLKYGASKADLWRYLIIYKFGGVYADMDCKCLTPLREWINPDADFVTQLGINKDICQWLILSVPNNPIFLRAAKKTIENSFQNITTTSHKGFELKNNQLVLSETEPIIKITHEVLALSGPPVLQKAAEECLEEGTIKDILTSCQVVCVSNKKSCQMKDHVIHDTRNRKYKQSYKKLNLTHYNSAIEKLKRKILSTISGSPTETKLK